VAIGSAEDGDFVVDECRTESQWFFFLLRFQLSRQWTTTAAERRKLIAEVEIHSYLLFEMFSSDVHKLKLQLNTI
jgi:hypothetical protein